MLWGVRAQVCLISGVSLQQVQFRDLAQVGSTRWVCAVTITTAPVSQPSLGSHSTHLNAPLQSFWEFSDLPGVLWNPKGAVKCHTQFPCGRNGIDYWTVPAGYDTVMDLVLVPQTAKLKLE